MKGRSDGEKVSLEDTSQEKDDSERLDTTNMRQNECSAFSSSSSSLQLSFNSPTFTSNLTLFKRTRFSRNESRIREGTQNKSGCNSHGNHMYPRISCLDECIKVTHFKRRKMFFSGCCCFYCRHPLM